MFMILWIKNLDGAQWGMARFCSSVSEASAAKIKRMWVSQQLGAGIPTGSATYTSGAQAALT